MGRWWFAVLGFIGSTLFAIIFVGPAGNWVYDWLKEHTSSLVRLVEQYWGRILTISLCVFALILVVFWRPIFNAFRPPTRRLAIPAEHLDPEDLGFQEVGSPQTADLSRRPFSPTYIPRAAVAYEASEHDDPILMTEDDLADCLRRGRSVILIGHPTEGKTRTLYQVLRQLVGHVVLRMPTSGALPPHTGLGSLRGRRTIVLFDDLNDYAHVWPQVRDLLDSVKEHAATVTYASTCRGGRELRAVREAIDSGLARFFEDFPERLCLVPASDDDKASLAQSLDRSWDDRQAEQFPTLGSVAMESPFGAMATRFAALSPEARDIMRALKLLTAAGALPLTVKRVTAVLQQVFERRGVRLADHLEVLTAEAFVREASGDREDAADDPIRPESAYLEYVVTYRSNQESKAYFPVIADVLESIDDFDGLEHLGLTYHDAGDFEASVDCFDRAIRLRPDAYEVWLEKARALDELGRYENVLEVSERLLRLRPDDLDGWAEKAKALKGSGRHREAIETCRLALAIDKDRIDVGLIYASSLLALRDAEGPEGGDEYTDEALEIIDHLTARYFYFASLWLLKAVLLLTLDRNEDALAAAEIAVMLQPRDANALSMKGEALYWLKRYEEAVASFQEAVAYDRRGFDSWEHLGVALHKLGQHHDALDAIEHALSQKADSPSCWFQRGQCLAALQHLDESIFAYREAIRFQPWYPEAWGNLGLRLANTGQTGEAEYWLCRAWQAREEIARNPDDGAANMETLQRAMRDLGLRPEVCEQVPIG